ncbi:MAG: hypothetical protein Q8O13_02850 [Candidatus Omnitrophota bacterium]|nr:hypothetical protein [Candidatus Omnitrophota bacterium]
MLTEKNNYWCIFLIFLVVFNFCGCAIFKENAKKQEAAKAFLEKQKENFNSLKNDLKNRKIEIGTAIEDIKSLYGEPSDTFGTSSQMSEFQMWTYEYPDASKKEAYQPIRLYFSNGKLTYWTH